MAVSGTISTTTFSTNRVIDHAFRRCRINSQRVTAEMQSIAQSILYLLLSELASVKTPSWCIEQITLPMYKGQPEITLPVGTVEVLNANYRSLQQQVGIETETATKYEVDFTEDIQVSTFGIKWSGAGTSVTVSTSDDGVAWQTVATVDYSSATAGEWSWFDIVPASAHQYFKIETATPFNYERVFLGNLPSEIPLGVLNKDTYTNQTNKVFEGRPTTYWFQRNRTQPIMHLWPAPNDAAEYAQLIVWRHRHIMDVGTLTQELDIPQRWFEAIVASLAAKLAQEIEQVDPQLIPLLTQMAAGAVNTAWTGDNDGSSSTILPWISPYTR